MKKNIFDSIFVSIILIGIILLLIPEQQRLTSKQKIYTALYEDLKNEQGVLVTQERYRRWYMKNGIPINAMDEKDYQYQNQKIRFLKKTILTSL